MSAEKGWIGEPQPAREGPYRSRASALSDWVKAEQERRRERGDYSTVTVKW